MKKGWVKWLNLAAVGVTLALIVVFFWHNVDALSGVDWARMSASIFPTLLLYGLSLALQAAVWIGVVSGLIGVRWGAWDVVTYLETHLVRRLPGLPWYMASRAALYQDRSANGAAAALTASALEWLGILATATIWIVAGFLGAGWALIPVVLIPAVFALVPWLSHREKLPQRLKLLRHLPPEPILVALGVYACVDRPVRCQGCCPRGGHRSRHADRNVVVECCCEYADRLRASRTRGP